MIGRWQQHPEEEERARLPRPFGRASATVLQGPWGDDPDEVRATGAMRVVGLIAVMLAAFFTWIALAEIDEVSRGQGTVIPHQRTQTIESLDGGILQALHVAEGQRVAKGQALARLDPTRSEADLEETRARYNQALARSHRLQAEVEGVPLSFPDELEDYPGVIALERALYEARASGLEQSMEGVRESLSLVRAELEITESLVAAGAAGEVELLQLRREASELERELDRIESDFLIEARQEFAEVRADVDALSSVLRGQEDSVRRQVLKSPVDGIVNSIDVTTIGGVVPANGRIMEIVPVDDQLLVETRISPRDIAFIHPDQAAMVRLTAYDYTTFGGLEGEVTGISPDTIRDEVNPEVFYYRVYIRTEADALSDAAGNTYPIEPGMIAEVDIRTGSRTILQYLLKPLHRAGDALRER